jgi:hypothetical protein
MAIVRNQEEQPISEHLLETLIPLLKEKAKRVITSSQLKYEDEIIDSAKIILCHHYKIPMKSEIFNNYSLEELLYESYLLTEMVNATKPQEEKTKDAQEKTVDVIKENSESLKSLFDDFKMPPAPSAADNLFSPEEQAESWNKIMDKDGFF